MPAGADIIRNRLQRGMQNLMKAHYDNCDTYLGSWLRLLDETPLLKDIIVPIDHYPLDFPKWESELWQNGAQLPDEESNRAAMCLAVLRYYRTNKGMLNVGSGLGRGLTNGDQIIREYVREFVTPLYEWISERLDLIASQIGPEDIFGEKMRYVDSSVASAYPGPYEKLGLAMQTLGTGTSETEWSAVGHYCREAVQDFAENLYQQYYEQACQQPIPIDKPIAKVRAVLDARRGQSKKPSLQRLLETLLSYWEEVIAYVNRGEHRAHDKMGIGRDDAKRCVLYTYLVMAELSQLLVT